jgi:signal transduction histidine kinase
MLMFLAASLHFFVLLIAHPMSETGFIGVEAHDHFVMIVLLIALLATACLIGLALYITGPLRRMSRSMDRIAAGDLGHRIPVRGRDEIAAMGHSFNTMAERILGMITGQKELMAGVSHELRSPLTRMKLSLELLRQESSGGDRIADLETEVDELDSLVEELLLASRIDLGAAPLEMESLDLSEIADRAWTRVDEQARARGITLVLHLAEDARQVEADRALVVRLLANLFDNSVRYAGEGRITVSSVRRADRVELTVTDEGPGVDEADLDRLFEPFFRADRSRSRRTGAGGLGLMIVRRVVEAHGGKVHARRGEPRGLAVVLDLPC